MLLWVQYLESKSPDGLIKNPKIIEIVDSLDYDFSQYSVTSDDRLSVSIRKQMIAREIQNFILMNPAGVVVSLGCGLDAYYELFKDTEITWYDLDLPPVIALKSQFFSETESYRLIGKSAMDFSWMQEIPKDKKVLIIA